jgi:hypothetical protein
MPGLPSGKGWAETAVWAGKALVKAGEVITAKRISAVVCVEVECRRARHKSFTYAFMHPGATHCAWKDVRKALSIEFDAVEPTAGGYGVQQPRSEICLAL